MAADFAPAMPEPKPALSTFGAVIIMLGIVIGGGIFAFPPLVADLTGSVGWMFAAWLLGAALTLVGALCYAELAAAFPNAGGDYHFLTLAYGRNVSFFFGWARAMVIITGSIALLSFVFGDYMSRVYVLGQNSSAVYAALTVAALTAINVSGLRRSARAQSLLTILLLAGMLCVLLAGILAPAADAPPLKQTAPPLNLGTALLFVLFAFGGWNEAAYVSAEVKGGARSMLRVLVIAVIVIAAIYLAFIWALLHNLGFSGLAESEAVAADAARRAFGATGEKIVGALVAVAALTSINATMIVGARANYSVAGDWPIIGFMNRWDGKRGAPVAAYLVQGAIALLLVLLAAFEQDGVRAMVEFTAPVFWFFFLLTGIALFVLRRKYPGRPRPFKVPLYPLLPLIFIVTCGYLLYRSLIHAQSQNSIEVALYVMAAGFAAWLVARSGNGRRGATE
jgi:basic amino acid/polyamine antiporter, APA family